MININEVKEFLRIDNNIEDGYLAILILLSKEICLNYLRLSDLDETVMAVKQAMLIIISYFYENREGTKDGIPQVVYSLLAPYRKEGF